MSGAGCPASISSGCRTPRCTRRRTGSGRRWSTPAGRGRTQRIVLALSPAMLRKAGSGFDLALACAVLAADGIRAGQPALNGAVLLGELALDGRLRPVRGVLPCLLAARAAGVARVVVPAAALAEARWSTASRCTGRPASAEVLRAGCRGELELRRPSPRPAPADRRSRSSTSPTCVGQDDARHACEIAAAGGHHLLLVGPPGTGKTMLAQRLRRTAAAARRVGGAGGDRRSAPSPGGCPTGSRSPPCPPLVAPHHSASMAALIGGGSGLPAPRGRLAGPPGRALPGRSSGVGARTSSMRCAPRWRRARSGWPRAEGTVELPGAVPAGAGRQPVPLRARARSRLRVPLARCGAATSAACPGRCSTGSTCGHE